MSTALVMLRKRAGLTQAEVADRLGVEQPTVSMMEAGLRKLTLDRAVELCGIYGGTLNQIAGLEPIIVWQRTEA